MNKVGMKQKFGVAFHLQIDGQTMMGKRRGSMRY
jgi:hypothetical protein